MLCRRCRSHPHLQPPAWIPTRNAAIGRILATSVRQTPIGWTCIAQPHVARASVNAKTNILRVQRLRLKANATPTHVSWWRNAQPRVIYARGSTVRHCNATLVLRFRSPSGGRFSRSTSQIANGCRMRTCAAQYPMRAYLMNGSHWVRGINITRRVRRRSRLDSCLSRWRGSMQRVCRRRRRTRRRHLQQRPSAIACLHKASACD